MDLQDTAQWEPIFVAYLNEHLSGEDAAHDLGHFRRVWKTAAYINQEEGGVADALVLLTAAYFHDLVSLPKDHPDRSVSSRLSAEQTEKLLQETFTGYPREKIAGVRHAIHAHSFSGGVEALTPEAKILQDADRMEALGAIGLARVFYTAGKMNSSLFDPLDPMALQRKPDDRRYALDHFALKLLKLPAMMQTATGRRLAEAHARYLTQFLEKIRAEIAGEYGAGQGR